jgi:hypothetical protein
MPRPRGRFASTTKLTGACVMALAISGCCCKTVDFGSGDAAALPAQLILGVPPAVAASADTITETVMQNVDFHVDDQIRLHVRRLHGVMKDLTGHHLVVLDDKKGLLLDIHSAEIALSAPDLTLLLNRYVFGYPGSPLRNLSVRTQGSQIVQTGVMHKVVDIPFEMTADVSVTPEGLIRLHPTEMKICTINGQGLMKALGLDLSKLLDLSKAKGVRVDKNDLLLDPLLILPPPAINGRLTAIRVQGDDLVQIFGDNESAASRASMQPGVAAANYVHFRGGSLRFGKLYMVASDLVAIDSDASDAFDFYLDYYATQLVAGYHVTQKDFGLVAYMPDFDDLSSAKGRPSPGR